MVFNSELLIKVQRGRFTLRLIEKSKLIENRCCASDKKAGFVPLCATFVLQHVHFSSVDQYSLI